MGLSPSFRLKTHASRCAVMAVCALSWGPSFSSAPARTTSTDRGFTGMMPHVGVQCLDFPCIELHAQQRASKVACHAFGGSVSATASHWYAANAKMHDKMRSLGRLLRIVGEKLASAVCEDALRACGGALQGAAEALLSERWEDVNDHIEMAHTQCSTFLPKEHLVALQQFLNGTPAAPDPREHLAALGKVLEARAESFGEACEALEDAVFEAAGALHAAARIFAAKPARETTRTNSWYGAGTPAGVGATRDPSIKEPRIAAFELERILAVSSAQERRAILRSMARRYHPDQNPGREREVLPVFLYVQQLRDKARSWGKS